MARKKYFVAEKATGNFIAEYPSYADAEKAIELYEESDRVQGFPQYDFYDIVDENHEHVEE